MTTYASILTDTALTIFADGRAHTVHKETSTFPKILEAYKAKEFAKAIELMDVATAVNDFGQGEITVKDGIVYYKNTSIDNVLTDRILTMMREGFDVKPMAAFLENLLQNPSRIAVQELYLFLESGDLPLTEDGHFLAYKKVKHDFKDIHSGKFDNTPGQVLEFARNEVDDDRRNLCSYGLHICSIKYLPNFGSSSRMEDKVVIVKVNPRDVVSVPADYNDTKCRVCKYEVLSEYTGPLDKSAWDRSVVTDSFLNGESWEDEDDSWDSWEEEETNNVSLDGGTFANDDNEERDHHHASTKPDRLDDDSAIVMHTGTHIPAEVINGADLARESLEADLARLNEKHVPINEEETNDEGSWNVDR